MSFSELMPELNFLNYILFLVLHPQHKHENVVSLHYHSECLAE